MKFGGKPTKEGVIIKKRVRLGAVADPTNSCPNFSRSDPC